MGGLSKITSTFDSVHRKSGFKNEWRSHWRKLDRHTQLLRSHCTVLFDRSTTVEWLTVATPAAISAVNADTLLFAWCLGGSGKCGDYQLAPGDYFMASVGDTAPTVSGNLELLCHFADATACGLKEPCLAGSAWDVFAASRTLTSFRCFGAASRLQQPSVTHLPFVTDGSPPPPAPDATESSPPLPMPSSTIHHFTLERDISDVASRCLQSWAHGHRQIVWHYFEEAFHQAAPAVPQCKWKRGDLVLPQSEFDAIASKRGARAARLSFVGRLLQCFGGAFSDMNVFWLGVRLPEPGRGVLFVDSDTEGSWLFVQAGPPDRSSKTLQPPVATAGGISKALLVSARGSFKRAVGIKRQGWAPVYTLQQCQSAEAEMQSHLATHPLCFVSDTHATQRAHARAVIEMIFPALSVMLGDTAALRTQADALDALGVCGCHDVMPLGLDMPVAIAVSLLGAAMVKYCIAAEVPDVTHALCGVVASFDPVAAATVAGNPRFRQRSAGAAPPNPTAAATAAEGPRLRQLLVDELRERVEAITHGVRARLINQVFSPPPICGVPGVPSANT